MGGNNPNGVNYLDLYLNGIMSEQLGVFSLDKRLYRTPLVAKNNVLVPLYSYCSILIRECMPNIFHGWMTILTYHG